MSFPCSRRKPDNEAGLARPPHAEALDDDFSRARKSRHGIEVARVKQQRRSNEFIEASLRSPPRGHRTEVGRQSPSGVERHAVSGDRLSAQKRLEPGERRVHVDLVDHLDQRGDRHVRDDLVGETEALRVGNRAATVAGEHVRMRLVEDVCVGRLLAHPCEQVEVADRARIRRQ